MGALFPLGTTATSLSQMCVPKCLLTLLKVPGATLLNNHDSRRITRDPSPGLSSLWPAALGTTAEATLLSTGVPAIIFNFRVQPSWRMWSENVDRHPHHPGSVPRLDSNTILSTPVHVSKSSHDSMTSQCQDGSTRSKKS